MIHRRDSVYWARLRKDKASAIAVGLVIVSTLASLLSLLGLLIEGTQSEARANPVYWLLLFPFAWWASGLVAYERRPVSMIPPALLLSVIASIATLVAAITTRNEYAIWVVSSSITTIGATSAMLFYRSSLLRNEGPAR